MFVYTFNSNRTVGKLLAVKQAKGGWTLGKYNIFSNLEIFQILNNNEANDYMKIISLV